MATLEFALELAKSAGEIIRDGYSKAKSVSQKCSVADLVTETDTQVEKFVHDVIKKAYPDHAFIGEESVSGGCAIEFGDSPTWIIDPVDGTSNFVHRFPFCCISIAYAVNRQVTIGVVYNPILEQMFYAEKGKGAFLNEEKISVSDAPCLSQSLILSEWGSQRDSTLDTKAKNLRSALEASRGVRSIGSAALSCCLVACGSAEAYFEYGIHCWDMAAGELIVAEAGGVSAQPHGASYDVMSRGILVACCEPVLREVAERVERIQFDRE